MNAKRSAVFLVLPLCVAILTFSLPAQALPSPECSDAIDNDGDGLTDYPGDTGCTSPEDSVEYSAPECSDGLDNDGDGVKDYPTDPECSSYEDDDEMHSPPEPAECEDGLDNDNNGEVDFPDDWGCSSAEDDVEIDGDYRCGVIDGTHCDGVVLHQDSGWLTGAVGHHFNYCMIDRPLLLKKQRQGRDAIKAYDQADSYGEFRHAVKPRWRGRFYVVAPKWNVPQSDDTCERKVSNVVRIR